MRGLFEVLHQAGFEHLSQKQAFVTLIRLANGYTKTKFLLTKDFNDMDAIKQLKPNACIEATPKEQKQAKKKLQQALYLLEQNYSKMPVAELAVVLYQCWNAPKTEYNAKQFSEDHYHELVSSSVELLFARFDMAIEVLNVADEMVPDSPEPLSWKEAAFFTAAGLGMGYLMFRASEDLRQCPLEEGIVPSFLI